MSLAWTQTTAPTSRPPAVTEAAGNLARPTALADPVRGEAGLAIGRRDMDIAAEPDDIVKAQFVEKGEQLDVAEAAIGQDRDDGALGQRLGEAEQTEVFIVVALSLQLALEDRQPQQRRRPAVVGDEVQRQGRLVACVEVGPIHGDDDRAALADHLGHPGAEHVPYDDALIAEQSVDLLDGVLGEPTSRLSQGMADDRNGERSARHDPERGAGQQIDALGVHIPGENRSQIITNEFNTIAKMLHRARRCPRGLVAATCS